MAFRLERRAWADPDQDTRATRFQKTGWRAKPTGSVSKTEETRRIVASSEMRARAADRDAPRLPRLLPRPR